ncbi:MAG: hypothetical protein CMQ61_02305 [Gammaproteobacteria bacterium]|nr:hypothetical protein [Gammaproteobacteria bacterium]
MLRIRLAGYRLVSQLFMGAAMILAGATASAADHPLPTDDKFKHLGVASCAGSSCHGSASPLEDSTVLQNEFVTWKREDAHSKAYDILLGKQSKRIARNLGLDQPAHEHPDCLICHSDYVKDASRQGKRYKKEDGVGCESCHGGAERWLGLHVSGATHEENVKAGMYPTDEPAARAKLCLSCHLGNKDRVITHRIMGAGHPRLSFELDTFTIIEPAHFSVDDDYKERKGVHTAARTWAVGQISASVTFLDALVSTPHKGLFPELVFFDCQACHHPMSYSVLEKHPGRAWQPRSTNGLGPGVVRLNDSNLLMLSAIAQGVSKDMSKQIRKAVRAMHLATGSGWKATKKAAQHIRALVIELNGRLPANLDAAAIQAMLSGVMSDGIHGQHRDYAAAEQGFLALDSLLSSLEVDGAITGSHSDRMRAAMDKLYMTLRTHEKGYRPSKDGYRPYEDDKDVYKAGKYVAAMKQLAAAFSR